MAKTNKQENTDVTFYSQGQVFKVLVATVEELTWHETWRAVKQGQSWDTYNTNVWVYVNMIVTVYNDYNPLNNGPYKLINIDYTNSGNWIKVVDNTSDQLHSLSMALVSESTSRSTNDLSLSSSISSESSLRGSSDSFLSTSLSGEISTRSSSDSLLSTSISIEESTRSSSISSESSLRTSADSSLSTVISGEISVRTSESSTYLKLAGGSLVGGLTGTTIYITGDAYGNDWIATSDVRLKENIVPIDDALTKVLNSRGVYFNFINDENKKQKIGVIAQEIEQIVPQVVFNGNETKGVSYGNLTALLLEAIKDLNTKVDNLQKEIKLLKNKQ